MLLSGWSWLKDLHALASGALQRQHAASVLEPTAVRSLRLNGGEANERVARSMRRACSELATLETLCTLGNALDGEQLISLKEAAARFPLSRSHLQLLARTGRLRAVRMGRDWFTTADAVVAYLSDAELRSKDPRKRKRT